LNGWKNEIIPKIKLKKNIECEIFQSVLDQAHESHKQEIVFELNSNNPEDMETNLGQIKDWIEHLSCLD